MIRLRRTLTLLALLTACADEGDARDEEASVRSEQRPADGQSPASPDHTGADAGAGASPASAALLSCQEADKELARLRNAIDPAARLALVRCSGDHECTTWSPKLECETRKVYLYPPISAVAVGKAEAAQSQLDALEPDLCPRIAPDCRATGDLGTSVLRCVSGECRLTATAAGS
jgi:hypothetical protein